ncbi:MAG: ABC transporter permease [Coriobacteriales bacterium]|nr:ABC transporter permease [Coriobacteriales bacterium]
MLLQIIGVTLRMSLTSSATALVLGAPWGAFLAFGSSKVKSVLIVVNRTLMGLPPVVCGLLCYLMFCGVGPLRFLHLLYTVEGMIVAQVILVTPIVAGTIEAYARPLVAPVRETGVGLGMSRPRILRLMIQECRYQVFTSYLLALGRALAEVGAVSMVGGAIAYKTNVMTTAIMMYTNRGDFKMAIALGIILVGLFFLLNILAHVLQPKVVA